jgi:hypothetical protein
LSPLHLRSNFSFACILKRGSRQKAPWGRLVVTGIRRMLIGNLP